MTASRTAESPPAAVGAGRDAVTRAEVLGLAAATAVVFGVAAVFLARREVWLDESLSYLIAAKGAGELWGFATSSDGELNMVAYYGLLSPFAEVSADASWLRLPSLLAAVATIPVVWLLTDRLSHDRFARIAAAAVFLTQPMLVDFAFEARSYALGMLATAGLTLLLVRALDGSRPAAVAYAALLVLAIGVHFVALLLVAAHCVAVVLVTAGPPARRALAVARLCGPALLVAAAASVVYRSQGTLRDREGLGLRAIGSTVYSLTGRAGPLTFLFVAAFAFGALALLRRRHQDGSATVPVVTVLVPPIMILALSASRPMFDARYLLNLLPLLCCIVGVGIAGALDSERNRRLALATFVVLGLAGQAFVYRTPDREQPDSATRFVLEHAGDDDLVVFESYVAAAPYERYLDDSGEDGPTTTGEVTDPENPLLPHDVTPLPTSVDALPAGASVWVVLNRSSEDEVEAVHRVLTDAGLVPTARESFSSVSVEQWTTT